MYILSMCVSTATAMQLLASCTRNQKLLTHMGKPASAALFSSQLVNLAASVITPRGGHFPCLSYQLATLEAPVVHQDAQPFLLLLSSGAGMGSGQGQQYGGQGTDSFGNVQAPVSKSGQTVYNADGQAVGTGDTSHTSGRQVSHGSSTTTTTTSHSGGGVGGGIASHLPGTQSHRDGHNTGIDYNAGRGTGAGTGSDFNSGSSTTGGGSGGGLASVIPGTQAYRDAHVRQGDDFEGAGVGQQGGSHSGGQGTGVGRGTHDNNYYEGRGSGGNVGSGQHGQQSAAGITSGQSVCASVCMCAGLQWWLCSNWLCVC